MKPGVWRKGVSRGAAASNRLRSPKRIARSHIKSRPRRTPAPYHADQTSAFGQLLEQRLGANLDRAVDENGVIGRIAGIALRREDP